MHLTFLRSFKVAATCGLVFVNHVLSAPLFFENTGNGTLAVAHVSPASIGFEDGERIHLDRRMLKRLGSKFGSKSSKSEGKKKKKDDPSRPPVRPAAEASTQQPVRRTNEERGREYLMGYKTKFAMDSPPSAGFRDYDAKRHQYTVRNTPKGGIPPITEVKVFDAPNLGPMNSPPPVFLAKVSRNTLSMERMKEYRSGDESELFYRNIKNVDDRIHISDHIAKAWEQNGGGYPMTLNQVKDIENREMLEQIRKWSPDGRPFDIPEGDPRWLWVLGSPSGSPLARAALDHPDPLHFHKHRPTNAHFFRDENNDWAINLKLEPGPPPDNVYRLHVPENSG